MSLRDRLLKTSKKAQILSESKEYNYNIDIPTQIPALNLLLSGEVGKGITPGITCWAGPSRHFKTLFCLISAKTYKDKFPDATIVMFDSEYGSPPNYIGSLGLDPEEIVHVPVDTYEELKFEANKIVKAVEPGENVFILIDSLGNLASAKEAKDADNENSAADMTRAKESKSFFRIITPLLKRRNIPMHVVQHTYDTMDFMPKKVIAGGQATLLSADNAFIIGRRQEKDGKELKGYHFVVNVEKSRFTREKSVIPILVTSEKGIFRWSGMFDLALELGIIEKVSAQLYKLKDSDEDDTFKRKNVEASSKFWKGVFNNTDFADMLKNKFKQDSLNLISDDIEDEEEDYNEEIEE